MKDYKRLTTKIGEGKYTVNCPNCPGEDEDCCNCTQNYNKRLGELEDKIEDGTLVEWKHKKECLEELNKLNTQLFEISQKIEQGRLIELPCKVDGVVYFVSKKKGIQWSGITEIQVLIDRYTQIIQVRDDDGKWWTVNNRNVFLTKEEAEAKLQELRGGK